MPMTAVPSFFAAARVRSHSVCHSAARRGEDNQIRNIPAPMKIDLDNLIERCFLIA
jgi:hypothetical protein